MQSKCYGRGMNWVPWDKRGGTLTDRLVVKKAMESRDRDLQPKLCAITQTTKDEN